MKDTLVLPVGLYAQRGAGTHDPKIKSRALQAEQAQAF